MVFGRFYLYIISTVFLSFSVAAASISDSSSQSIFYVITIEGVINPVSAEYIVKSIEDAELNNADGLIIELDTPGGLMESMRMIVKAELEADVPIIVYVGPSGSRAGSAGVFITLAAHIAVMDNGTNIGAAHPVGLGGSSPDSGSAMWDKITNDAVAQIRSIAEKRNRNADWAAKSVSESASITEIEALELYVIDYISPNIESLLEAIDGDSVQLESRQVVLNTKDAKIVRKEVGFRYKFLLILSDPNIAYLFMMLGFYGLFFEFSNPGSLVPGILGGIFIILALFSFQTLPINWAGVALILFAIILFILEIKVISYGGLTLGGIVSMVLGSIMLIDSPIPAMRVSLTMIIPVVFFTAAFFLISMYLYYKAQKRKPTTGKQGLIGETGVARSDVGAAGKINIHGEIWNAFSDEPISAGESVEVISVEGLKIKIKKKIIN